MTSNNFHTHVEMSNVTLSRSYLDGFLNHCSSRLVFAKNFTYPMTFADEHLYLRHRTSREASHVRIKSMVTVAICDNVVPTSHSEHVEAS